MIVSEKIKYLTVIDLFILILTISCNRQPEKTDATEMIPDSKIRLSEAQIQLANIAVTEVREGTISSSLILTGSLKVNEQSSVSITSRSNGRIEKLFFKTTGENVNPGDSLYKFYSEDLVAAEREYYTIQSGNWNYSGKYPPSLLLENKLLFLGMVPSQVTQLKVEGKILFTATILSQVKGTIRSVNVTEGQYVKTGEKLFELAGDNTLWVEAQAYPNDLQYLNVGMGANIIIPSEMNREIKARINYINPAFEPGKNITIVRTSINNYDKRLFPGMRVLLNIPSQRIRGIIIPLSAVIVEKSGSKVWVRDESGAFSDRIVTTGIQSADSILVLSGMDRYDKVVTSGAYLLNSEMILKNGKASGDQKEM